MQYQRIDRKPILSEIVISMLEKNKERERAREWYFTQNALLNQYHWEATFLQRLERNLRRQTYV
jgi:hypothetical protein